MRQDTDSFRRFDVYLSFVSYRTLAATFIRYIDDTKVRQTVAILSAASLRLNELCHLRCCDIYSFFKKELCQPLLKPFGPSRSIGGPAYTQSGGAGSTESADRPRPSDTGSTHTEFISRSLPKYIFLPPVHASFRILYIETSFFLLAFPL